MKEGSKRVEEEEGRSRWRGRGEGRKKGKNCRYKQLQGRRKNREEC